VLVSVLLPVKDAAPTLPACIASLRAQTLVDHEVVAVDDGSTDGSAGILQAAAAADPRWRVLHQPPSGLVPALERARAAAGAPLLARMDADDVCRPERLARQVERLGREPGLGVCATAVELFGGADNEGMRGYVEWSNALLTHDEIVGEMLVESPLVHPSVVLRASLLQELGGYRDHAFPEDYDLWLRAQAAGARFAKLPEPLLRWRDSARRLTRTDPRYGPDRFRALKVEALERGPLRPGRPVVVWGAGPLGKRFARDLLARGHRVVAFADVHPRRLGARVHGVPVVPSAEAAAHEGALHLAAVGQPGGRARVRAEAARVGVRGEDIVAVA
jgi:glycosyltransferase involved in cell wall biosynthesis